MSNKRIQAGRPWLHQEVIDWLEQILKPEWRVLETGMGGSTIFFAERITHVTSFEHNSLWFTAIRRELFARRLEHKCTSNLSPSYPSEGLGSNAPSRLDLCLIDGRGRVKSMTDAITLIRPGGWLMLDDSNRERYKAGKAAADHASSYSSVFDFGEDQTTIWQISK